MSMGEAIALGIAKGVGQGYSQHFADQRRERMEMRRMDKSFDMFKKQSQYSYGLQEIGKQNEALGSWEQTAKLGVNDIALQGATKMAMSYAPKDRPAFIRHTMKNLSGMDKPSLLSHFGYNKPDYSQWINNPDYQDAIPMARIAGMADMPGADEVFKYDPRMVQQEQKVQAEKVTDYMRKKQDIFAGISSTAVVTFGAKTSDAVSNLLWQARPSGENVVMKGAEAVSYDQNMLTSLIDSGQVVKVGTTLKLRNELTDNEAIRYGYAEEAPLMDPMVSTGTQETTTDVPSMLARPEGGAAPLYTEPQSADYIATQEQKKADKAMDSTVKSMAKDLGTGKGTPLTTYTELSDSVDMINNMSPDALDYLFQVGFSNDSVRDVAAKFGDENAQMAKNLISKMSGTVNSIRHDLFGSALTEGESAAFQKQFADVGAFNTKENLLAQLNNLLDKSQMGVAEKMAGYTPETRQAFLERNPQYEGVMGQVDLGQSPEESTGKPTVSDSQGQDVTATLPEQFWTASPAKQQEFLTKYGLTLGK